MNESDLTELLQIIPEFRRCNSTIGESLEKNPAVEILKIRMSVSSKLDNKNLIRPDVGQQLTGFCPYK